MIKYLFSLPLFQKTLPRSSKVGLGTFGKKFKPPEITEEDRIKAACEVKKNTVRSSVMELWRQLQVGRYVVSFPGTHLGMGMRLVLIGWGPKSTCETLMNE